MAFFEFEFFFTKISSHDFILELEGATPIEEIQHWKRKLPETIHLGIRRSISNTKAKFDCSRLYTRN